MHAFSVLLYALRASSPLHVLRLIVKRLVKDRRQLIELARQFILFRQLFCLELIMRDGDLISLHGNEDLIVTALSR